MALSPADQQAARLAAVVALAARALAAVWPRVDWTSEHAVDAVGTLYGAIVNRYGKQAAAVSASYYDQRRAEQNLTSRYRAAPAAPVQQNAVERIVSSAFLGRTTADAATADLDAPAAPATTSDLPVDQRVQQRLEQGLSRLVQQPARDTIVDNSAKDPAKPRWIRVPTGATTCAFCIMLASREQNEHFGGYRSEHVALFAENGQKYHKNCDCVAVPVFPGDDVWNLSPNIGDYQDLYYKATKAAGTHRDTAKILSEMRRLIKEQQPAPAPQPEPLPQPVNLDAPKPAPVKPARPKQDSAAQVSDPLADVRRKTDLKPDPAADLEATNPNFAAGEQWQINCSRCATTMELRARGYDVTTEPKPPQVKDNGYASILQRWTSPDGTPAGTGAGPRATRAATHGEILGMSDGTRVWHWLPAGSTDAKQAATDAAQKWGHGARGYITVTWKGGRGAHIFNVENRNGTVVFSDGQTNSADVSAYWDRISQLGDSCRIVRTDDLTPTAQVMQWCRERTDADITLADKKAALLRRLSQKSGASVTGDVGAPPPPHPGDSDHADDALQYLKTTARAAEPAATTMVSDLARVIGGNVERLNSRFKTDTSIAEKLDRFRRRVSPHYRLAKFNDALRYTIVIPDDDSYWPASRAAIAAIETHGFTVTNDPAGWRSDYRGMNLTVQDSAGRQFEVQLHTRASLEVSERTHGLYEQLRKLNHGDPRAAELAAQIGQEYAQVPWPRGLPRV